MSIPVAPLWLEVEVPQLIIFEMTLLLVFQGWLWNTYVYLSLVLPASLWGSSNNFSLFHPNNILGIQQEGGFFWYKLLIIFSAFAFACSFSPFHYICQDPSYDLWVCRVLHFWLFALFLLNDFGKLIPFCSKYPIVGSHSNFLRVIIMKGV